MVSGFGKSFDGISQEIYAMSLSFTVLKEPFLSKKIA